MIDFDMFRDLHQKEPEDERQSAPTTSDAMVPPEVMDKDEPDDPNFFLLLPSNVFGFSMKDKKWSKFILSFKSWYSSVRLQPQETFRLSTFNRYPGIQKPSNDWFSIIGRKSLLKP